MSRSSQDRSPESLPGADVLPRKLERASATGVHANQRDSWPVAALPWMVLVLLVAAWAAIQWPAALLVLLVAVLVVVCLGRWPEMAIYLVVLVLYCNVAVIAVRFHGVPRLVGLAAPAPLLIPLVAQWLRQRGVRVVSTLRWVTLFLGVQLLSALFSDDPRNSVEEMVSVFLEGWCLYFLFTNLLTSDRVVHRVMVVLLIAGAGMGGLALFQKVTRTYSRDYGGFAQVAEGDGFAVSEDRGERRQKRLAGPIGEQNRFAQIMVVLLPIGWFVIGNAASVAGRAAAIAATLLVAAGCCLAYSRGAAFGMAAILLLGIALGMIRLRHCLPLGLCAILVLCLTPEYLTRLSSLPARLNLAEAETVDDNQWDGAMRGRATAMLAAARVFADHPILGVGTGRFNEYSRIYGQEGGLRALEGTREAHNLVLEIAAEHGLMGLSAFAVLLGVSLTRLTRTGRNASDPKLGRLARTWILVLAAYLATGMFLHFSYARYFWILLAIADSISHLPMPSVRRSEHAREPALDSEGA